MHRTVWLLLPFCLGCQDLPHTFPNGKTMTALSDPVSLDSPVLVWTSKNAAAPENRALAEREKHVASQPNDLVARLQLAEDYLEVGKAKEARFHLELFVAVAQDEGADAIPYLVRAHGRLLDVAEACHDEFDEQLHRGIGLYWLAHLRAAEPEPHEEYSPQSLHCRAAEELHAARKLQSDQARVHLYLGLALEHLGQHRQALAAFREADQRALLSPLTPWERRMLGRMLLASTGEDAAPPRRLGNR